ncbi:MAG: heavy-metal-associated domain-containing protein [Nitrospirota bacterium]|jgi:copper chaperone CopZ
MGFATVKVKEMYCEKCIEEVRQVLQTIPGLRELDVEMGRASFCYDDGRLSLKDVAQVLGEIGYPVFL